MLKEKIVLESRKPPEDVFAALTDLGWLCEMAEGKVTVEKAEGRPEKGPGSAVLLKFALPGLDGGLCETIDWDQPWKCVRRLDMKNLTVTVALSIEKSKGGTKAVLDLEIEAASFMTRMMLPVMAKQFEKRKDAVAARLQKRLDAA